MSVCSKGYGKSERPTNDDDDSDNEDADTDVEMEEDQEEMSRGADEKSNVSVAESAVYDHSHSVDVPSTLSAHAQSVRPQIIVTPRKMASAIESATAAVLAKNRKTSLEECATNEVPLEFIPACVFGPDGRKSGEGSSPMKLAKDGDRASSSKTVIVRAGCSTVSGDLNFTVQGPF